MKSLLQGFRQYADFSGTTPRRSFWEFVSVSQLILIILLIPAFCFFSEFYHEVINDPRVQALILDIVQTQEILYQELAGLVAEIWQSFAGDILTTHTTTLICTGGAIAWGAIICIPTLAITARRLQDAGHSRWWICPIILLCIPLPIIADIGFIGSIITLIYCSQESRGQDSLPPIPGSGHTVQSR